MLSAEMLGIVESNFEIVWSSAEFLSITILIIFGKLFVEYTYLHIYIYMYVCVCIYINIYSFSMAEANRESILLVSGLPQL